MRAGVGSAGLGGRPLVLLALLALLPRVPAWPVRTPDAAQSSCMCMCINM